MDPESVFVIVGSYMLLLVLIIQNFLESRKSNQLLNEVSSILKRNDRLLELIGEIIAKAAKVEKEEAPEHKAGID